MPFFRSHVLVSVDPECVKRGAHNVLDSLQDELVELGLIDEIQVLETSRLGDPFQYGPDMVVYPEGVHYVGLTEDDIPFLVQEHFLKGRVVDRLVLKERPQVDEELRAPQPKEVWSCCATADLLTLKISRTTSRKMAIWHLDRPS